MGNVYQSLRDAVQDTFQRGKVSPMPPPRAKTNGAFTLNDEVKELEKLFLDKVGRLSARIKENEEWVAGEAKHAEDLIDRLRLNIAELETKLKETEDIGLKNELARREAEAKLRANVQNLQNELRITQERLNDRDTEINQLYVKADAQLKQLSDLESAIGTAKADAAGESKRADVLSETLQAKIAGFEAQLTDKDDVIRLKDLAISRLEENLNAKVQQLENRLASDGEILTARDAEINALKSQLKTLTKGLEQMAFLFRKAEALAASDGESLSATRPTLGSDAAPSNPTPGPIAEFTQFAPAVTSELVSDYAFGDIIRELAELTNVIGLVASVIVREHVTALGELMEKFPKARLAELIESLSHEIVDESRKASFRERVGNL